MTRRENGRELIVYGLRELNKTARGSGQGESKSAQAPGL